MDTKNIPRISLAKMKNQLHLSDKEFTSLIQCPLTGEQYLQLLVDRGVIEADENTLE
ncbi:MAG: hypothetical protein WC379_17445 [Methanoregula sp.]|jgi:hypothetical protein